MSRTLLLSLILATFPLVACDKSDAPASPAQPSTPTQTTNAQTQGAQGATQQVVAPAAKPIVIEDIDLATSADFEEEAEKAISAKNYKTELASLEADVGKD